MMVCLRTALVVARLCRALAASSRALVVGQLPLCKYIAAIMRVGSGRSEAAVKLRVEVAVSRT